MNSSSSLRMAPAAVSRAPPRFVAVFPFEVRLITLPARFFAMAILPGGRCDGSARPPRRSASVGPCGVNRRESARALAPCQANAGTSVSRGEDALHALELIASAEGKEPVAAREGEVATGIHDGRAVADDGEHGGAGDLPQGERLETTSHRPAAGTHRHCLDVERLVAAAQR